MALSKITQAEIKEWGGASVEYKGFDIYAGAAKGGGYDASIQVMWAPDGEHDGAVNIDYVWGDTIAELHQEIRDFVKRFTRDNEITANQIRALALKHNFHGSFEDLMKK